MTTKANAGAFGQPAHKRVPTCAYWYTPEGKAKLRIMREWKRRASKGALVPETPNKPAVGPYRTRQIEVIE